MLPAVTTYDVPPPPAFLQGEVTRAMTRRTSLPQPWDSSTWIQSRRGRVDVVYEICSGKVFPRPRVQARSWDWARYNTDALSPVSREAVVNWLADRSIAAYVCHEIFYRYPLAESASRHVRDCSAIDHPRQFVRYVEARPDQRSRSDVARVVADAMIESGACSRAAH